MQCRNEHAQNWARELHAQGVPASEAVTIMVRESRKQARELQKENKIDGVTPSHFIMTPLDQDEARHFVGLVYGDPSGTVE